MLGSRVPLFSIYIINTFSFNFHCEKSVEIDHLDKYGHEYCLDMGEVKQKLIVEVMSALMLRNHTSKNWQ